MTLPTSNRGWTYPTEYLDPWYNELFALFEEIDQDVQDIIDGKLGNRQRAVKDYVDCTAAPPTEVSGDRYILDFTVGSVHANWDSASKGDVVTFDGSAWVAETPVEGWIAYVDALDIDYQYTDDTPGWTAVGGALAFADLSDVTSATATAGNLMVADGSAWVGVSVTGAVVMAASGEVTFNATAETTPDTADLVLIYDDTASAYKQMTRGNFLSDVVFVGTDIAMADHSISGIDNLTFTDVNGAIAGIENQNLVDKTATESISGTWTFTTNFPVTPSSAPSGNYEVANKKYVDDALATVDTWAEVLALGNITSGTNPTISKNDTIDFLGATSGTISLTPVAVAGTNTLSLPAATDTLVGKATTDTFTNKSLSFTTNTVTGTAAEFDTACSDDNFAFVSDNLSVFAATTSLQLAGVISDETGTGSLVFATSPSLVTPALGVATATSLNIGSTVVVVGVIDSDTMTGASDTTLATSESIKAYVDTSIATADTWAETLALGSASGGTNPTISKNDTIDFLGATSGTISLSPVAVAGTNTLSLPAATDTLIGKATTDTLTNKSISFTTNTITGTAAEFDTACSDDNFAYVSDKLSVFSATTSAELAGVISDETGTGVLVFGTAPVFTTSITVTGGGVIDSDGVDVDTDNFYAINNVSVLSATTLGSSVVTSSLTSVGTLTGLTMGGNIVMGDNSVTGIDTLTFTDVNGTIAGIENQNLVDKSATETISGAWTFSTSLSLSDNIPLRLGNGPNCYLSYDLTQTNEALQLTLDSANRTLIIVDTANLTDNYAHADQDNPTVFGHSAIAAGTATDQWWSLTHDQTDMVIGIGSGSKVTEHVDPVSLADDAYFDLPDASAGFGTIMVGDGEAYLQIKWETDGTVLIMNDVGSVQNSNLDSYFCVFDNGTAVRVRNRLGSAKTVMFDYHFTTSP